MNDENGRDDFKPINKGWSLQPLGESPVGGDIHETFHANEAGEVSEGHTTVRIPGGQSVHLPWNP